MAPSSRTDRKVIGVVKGHWSAMLFGEALRELLDFYGYEQVVEDRTVKIHTIHIVGKPEVPNLNKWKRV